MQSKGQGRTDNLTLRHNDRLYMMKEKVRVGSEGVVSADAILDEEYTEVAELSQTTANGGLCGPHRFRHKCDGRESPALASTLLTQVECQHKSPAGQFTAIEQFAGNQRIAAGQILVDLILGAVVNQVAAVEVIAILFLPRQKSATLQFVDGGIDGGGSHAGQAGEHGNTFAAHSEAI